MIGRKTIVGRWGTSTEHDDVRIDPISAALSTITVAHNRLHGGAAFVSQFADETLADNATIIIAFKTPTGTNRVHMTAEITTLVGGDLEVWEDPTWTAQTGALLPILNRKRLAAMTSSAILENQAQAGFAASDNLISNPTGLNTGSATSVFRLYTWGKVATIGASKTRDSSELILKPDTQYAYVFTADGGSNKAQIFLDWYEATDLH